VGDRPVTVETYPEQIARLERERDDETQRAESLLTTLLDVTAQAEDGARRRVALLAQEATEKARANAAEKRLADLRAWAAARAPYHDMAGEVVARIDGKDGG
jgi:K+/H+ antiporter YhaU regulatory subunit KhtT